MPRYKIPAHIAIPAPNQNNSVVAMPLIQAAINSMSTYCSANSIPEKVACEHAGISYTIWMNSKTGLRPWLLNVVLGALSLTGFTLELRLKDSA